MRERGAATPSHPGETSPQLAVRGPRKDVPAEAPGTGETALPDALELAARLADLTLRIDRVRARAFPVEVPGYGREPRPASLVIVEGDGVEGAGECVAWTSDGQARFAARAPEVLAAGRSRLGDVVRRLAREAVDPYERAALEMATADLALRQAETNPFRLAGLVPRPARCLRSFDALADPVASLERALGRGARARLKLDVSPGWSDETLRELRALDRVAILDLKRRGDLELAERVHAHLPEALVEDPAVTEGSVRPSRSLGRRIAFDEPVKTSADVARLPVEPVAVNVKPSRMGGLFEALRTIAECRARGIRTYVGGMFEVGPGRSQLQVLAALFAPDEWSDVAPLVTRDTLPGDGVVVIPRDFQGLGFVHGAAGVPSVRTVSDRRPDAAGPA